MQTPSRREYWDEHSAHLWPVVSALRQPSMKSEMWTQAADVADLT
jgi:hypothetical protein